MTHSDGVGPLAAGRLDPADAANDPFAILGAWLSEAAAREPNDPTAMALATVDAQGAPNLRMVLLKGIEARGLAFYTNSESQKGRELDAAGTAAVNFHWKSLRRQARARGNVVRAGAAAADAYFETRPYRSRIGAWASRQSRPLESRAALEAEVAAFSQKYPENPPRPPHWGGYVLAPLEIEFWLDGEDRLHHRFQWRRSELGGAWRVTRLNP